MKNNYSVNRSVLNFIHARDYYSKEVAEEFKATLLSVKEKYLPVVDGFELQNFNMVSPEDELILGAMLGEYVKIDIDKSGFFRIPYTNQVKFESFTSLTEWRLAVALEDNVFTTYSHVSGIKTALEQHDLDYSNSDDWIIESKAIIRQGDAIFYRPWVFHSFEGKLLYCHFIKGE